MAASHSLEPVLIELLAAYRRQGPAEVVAYYDTAARLTDAAVDGQPVDLLLLAGDTQVDRLRVENLLQRETVLAETRLALYVPYGAPTRASQGLPGIAAAVRGKRFGRFVIPDPQRSEHGVAARAVLQEAGLWGLLQPHLSLADDAAQAARFAAGGSAQAGLIPAHLARTEAMIRRGRWEPVGAGASVRYHLVLLSEHGPDAPALFEFLQGPEASEILSEQGFTITPAP
ncbi:MAG: molybdate ABC transporter substrate-binding protein [Ectothiorhodospiraceae bacterium]|nr:molybdate ABC transporter substrate-binding protein [Ectothiorhodospiraceae bacterium]MCH8505108.1 molybdate ABC transporter substrate-binding protein [Ectothiorhodospiraceae bacterium]